MKTNMQYVCKCNNCDKYLIDTNPKGDAIKFNVAHLNLKSLVTVDNIQVCPNCGTDDYLDDIDDLKIG